jgi:hypothetical protein
LVASKAKQKHQLQLMVEDLKELCAQFTTIKAGQLTQLALAPNRSYKTTAAKSKLQPPLPPTKTDMTIIHARTGTTPLKEVDTETVVRKTNKILDKLNATVQVKAISFLPLVDFSSYSNNCQQKE